MRLYVAFEAEANLTFPNFRCCFRLYHQCWFGSVFLLFLLCMLASPLTHLLKVYWPIGPNKASHAISKSNESINSLPKCHIYWITINTWMSRFTKFISLPLTLFPFLPKVKTQFKHKTFTTFLLYSSSHSLDFPSTPLPFLGCIQWYHSNGDAHEIIYDHLNYFGIYVLSIFVPYEKKKLMRIVWIKSFVHRISVGSMGCKCEWCSIELARADDREK